MSQATPLMAGKKGLIIGIANDRSLAWGITRAVAAHGAELALTYQGEALRQAGRARSPRASAHLWCCPATSPIAPASMRCSRRSREKWRRLDFVVHAIAFSDKEQLKGRYLETTAANFERTMMISCYSFTELCRRAAPLMADGGSLLTLTYAGSRAGHAALQRHGRRQGGAGGERALSGGGPRPASDPRQRDLGRAGQDARRIRHRRLPLHPEVERAQRAAASATTRSRTSAAPRSTC